MSAITTAPAAQPRQARFAIAAWLRPSLLDCLVIALLLWLIGFTATGGAAGLLQDAGTGYHIRVGDLVLNRHAVPRSDVFSFTRGGQPWYAWEWLSGVLFAFLHRAAGLKGVILLSAGAIASTIAVLVRHMISRGANALTALFLAHIGIAVSSLHFLARPHLFTFLFLAVSLYLIHRDLTAPSRWIFLLVPLAALWANLHGGFIALPVSLACFAVKERRYAKLAGWCLLASGLNPYGFTEHLHILRYMNATWIRQIVLEFQGPRFDGLQGIYAEIVVVGAGMLALRAFLRRDFAHGLLVTVWLHAGLQSVRYLPVLAIVALPVAAAELRSVRMPRTLADIAADHTPGLARISFWPAVAFAAIALTNTLPFPSDFPEPRYPVSVVTKHAALLARSRVFSTDAYGDYLTYRLAPFGRVFIDGRSDMYGEQLANEYLVALNGQRGWNRVLSRYGVNAALIPADAPLASLLRREPGWMPIEDGPDFALFRLRPVDDFGSTADEH